MWSLLVGKLIPESIPLPTRKIYNKVVVLCLSRLEMGTVDSQALSLPVAIYGLILI